MKCRRDRRGPSRACRPIPRTTRKKYSYDEDAHEIIVGDGRFGPVAPAIWEFEVSGLKVVQSWLGYRMKKARRQEILAPSTISAPSTGRRG